MIERIENPTNPDYYAFRVPLPPPGRRPKKDTIAAIDRWHLHLPGQAIWEWYGLLGCALRDFDGVPPAEKHFPEATHELCVVAIDPKYPLEQLFAGGVSPLEPFNYVEQFQCKDDAHANRVLKEVAKEFVWCLMPAEPQGIRGARELFHRYLLATVEGTT